ncbi:MAG: branched-chain amino acid ABC transporter permease [Alphaproteobacteria bacterium]
MIELAGFSSVLVQFATFAGIFALLALGLNLQWGMGGLFNIGIAGFFAVGAYASAILTGAASPSHLGGFAMPFILGALAAMSVSGLIALVIGLITLRLRADYLAIATIGIAEILRLFLKNEDWLTNGVRGIAGIAKPHAAFLGPGWAALVFFAIVLVSVLLVYLGLERARRSPWGRVLRAVRENEETAAASGKNTVRFRLEAFVLGSMIMGYGGALYAHFFGFISPEAFEPELTTFLVWIMLIAGGSGNNRGAILGAVAIWLVWSGTEVLTNRLPPEFVTQAGAIRLLLIGALLQVILLLRPEGLLKERPPPAPLPPKGVPPKGVPPKGVPPKGVPPRGEARPPRGPAPPPSSRA